MLRLPLRRVLASPANWVAISGKQITVWSWLIPEELCKHLVVNVELRVGVSLPDVSLPHPNERNSQLGHAYFICWITKKTKLFHNRPSSFCSRYPNMCDRTKKVDYGVKISQEYLLFHQVRS
jgi:hypothetical protein